MISADVRFGGFDGPSWARLLSLFQPARTEGEDLLVVFRPAHTHEGAAEAGERVIVSALLRGAGRYPALIGKPLPPLRELAAQLGVRRILALEVGAMEELAERVGAAVDVTDDYLTQVLTVLRVAGELRSEGRIRPWPDPLRGVPLPSPAAVRRVLDLVLPDDRAAIVGLWERSGERRLWTAFVCRRRGGAIDLVAGPDVVHRTAGPLGGDWRRDYRVLVDAVERTVAPVHLGVFTEAETLARLLREGTAGAWAREVAVRNVVLRPAPPPVLAALGADALRGVGKASAKALGGIDFGRLALGLGRAARARFLEGRSVSEILGFDPMLALAAFLGRPPNEGEDPPDE